MKGLDESRPDSPPTVIPGRSVAGVSWYAAWFTRLVFFIYRRWLPKPLQQWLLTQMIVQTPHDTFTLEWLISRANRDLYNWDQVHARLVAEEHSGIPFAAPPEVFSDLLRLLFHIGPANRGICQLDLDEALALWTLCRRSPGGVFVEIGRFKGGSTLLLASAGGTGSRLLSFDISSQHDADCAAALADLGLADRVQLIVGNSRASDLFRTLAPDLVFVDGGHAYDDVTADIDAWYPSLKPGGVMCFHDAAFARPNATRLSSVARAVHDMRSSPKYDCVRLLEVGSLLAVRKNGAVQGAL